jgi:coenzyme Q-binding protein COQ10
MPLLRNERILPHKIDKLYEIITDVEKYPEFIPWFKKIKITSIKDNIVITDVIVEFLFIRDNYTSTTELHRPTIVNGENIASAIVTMVDGPFNNFVTIWSLTELDDNKCLVEFKCDFSFNNKLYDDMAQVALKPMNKKIIDAFVKRAANVK